MHDTLLARFLQNSMVQCYDTTEQQDSTSLRETVKSQEMLELKQKKIAINSEYN